MRWVIPGFRFTPRLLEELAAQLKAEVSSVQDRFDFQKTDAVDLETLLDLLRTANPADVSRISTRLSATDIDVLCYGFAGIDQKDQAKPAAIEIIKLRWKRRYGRAVWHQFQSNYDDPAIAELLVTALLKESLPKLAKVSDILLEVCRAEHPDTALALVFIEDTLPFDELVIQFDIDPESKLAIASLRQYMLLANRQLYRGREDAEFIDRVLVMLWHGWPDDYRIIVDRYLQMFAHEECDSGDVFLNNVLQHLQRPDEVLGTVLWHGISKDSQERFIRWLGWRTVEEFFKERDHERLDFWAWFRNYLVDARARRAGNTEAVFLVFEEVAVIEFLEIGNAAYLYQRAVYERDYGQFANGRRPIHHTSMLKNTDTANFRILHGVNWQNNYYGRVARAIRGRGV